MNYLSIAGAIGILLVLVIVHEAGHFFVARYFGMQTPLVGLGLPFFGGYLSLGRIADVEFRLHPLLIGAYVSIPEMEDESDDEMPLAQPKRAFPAWQRLLVSFAGPAANILFALVLGVILATFVGVPQELGKAVLVASVSEGSDPIVKEELKQGDRILRVEKSEITEATQLRDELGKKPNTQINVDIQRQFAESGAYCASLILPTNAEGKLGIGLQESIAELKYIPAEGIPVLAQLKAGWDYFARWVEVCFRVLGFLFSAPFRQNEAGAPKLGDVHGIIVATDIIAKSFAEGLDTIINLSALISLELAIFNLLPIMPLDGGHILFQSIEMVSGKNKKLFFFRDMVAQFGLFLMLGLAALVFFNDIRMLFFKL